MPLPSSPLPSPDILTTAPERFLADFFASLTEAVLTGDGGPEEPVDRHFTPDIVQLSDGIRLDRDRLVAHLRPVRKNAVACHYEIHEAIADGPRVAARFTVHARMRKGRLLSTEVHFFGDFAADGRMRRAHQLTRALPDAGVPGEADR
ncbi:nuclear transport factor 2 family protein [Streptomyces sp. NPDC127068]|uniref:nuclear transport factor 2 family protein n=1 Tax=Streptomyces sp. NPDC127068 TaxID=3347127 RepID=UPI003647F78C